MVGGDWFWHELYSARGGFEAIYADVQRPIGFLRFAKTVPAKGSVFSARERLHREGSGGHTPAVYRNRAIGSGCLGHPDIRTNVHAD